MDMQHTVQNMNLTEELMVQECQRLQAVFPAAEIMMEDAPRGFPMPWMAMCFDGVAWLILYSDAFPETPPCLLCSDGETAGKLSRAVVFRGRSWNAGETLVEAGQIQEAQRTVQTLISEGWHLVSARYTEEAWAFIRQMESPTAEILTWIHEALGRMEMQRPAAQSAARRQRGQAEDADVRHEGLWEADYLAQAGAIPRPGAAKKHVPEPDREQPKGLLDRLIDKALGSDGEV